jgi:hypothetical protein
MLWEMELIISQTNQEKNWRIYLLLGQKLCENDFVVEDQHSQQA